jgi:hypothetical protein
MHNTTTNILTMPVLKLAYLLFICLFIFWSFFFNMLPKRSLMELRLQPLKADTLGLIYQSALASILEQ